MYPDYSNSLLNLEDIFIKKILHADSFVKIFIETKVKHHSCGQMTSRAHDYRSQGIKNLPFQLEYTILVLKKQRYICNCEILEFEKCVATFRNWKREILNA